jgi:tetratricopeptide (TPR) repeat protein
LTAVNEAGAYAVFTTSKDGAVHPVAQASPAAIAAAGARPALPRVRVLPEANRLLLQKHGFKLGPASVAGVPPKDADAWLRELQVVRWLMSPMRPQLAARRAKVLLSEAPDCLAILVTRLVMLSTTSSEEGWELRDKLLALYPDRSDALHWAAHTSIVDHNLEAAAALLDAALAVGPVEPEMYYDRACVYVRAGDDKAALAELKTAIEAGYRNWDWIDKDPDMASLRPSPEFVELLRTHGR